MTGVVPPVGWRECGQLIWSRLLRFYYRNRCTQEATRSSIWLIDDVAPSTTPMSSTCCCASADSQVLRERRCRAGEGEDVLGDPRCWHQVEVQVGESVSKEKLVGSSTAVICQVSGVLVTL